MDQSKRPDTEVKWDEMVETVERAAEERAWRPRPGRGLVHAGQICLAVCAAALLVGGKIVRAGFPEQLGAGLDPTTLLMLVPIWTTGLVGLVLILLGKLKQWRA
jgi:hypothetical protein